MNPPRMRLVPAAALLAAAMLAATGCSTGSDASDLMADQPSAGPDITEFQAAGALREYVGAVNRALHTGRTTTLASMTGRACPCRDLVELIADRYRDHGAIVGASFGAGDVTVLQRRGREARVQAQMSVSRYHVRTPDGLAVGRQRAQEYVATYTLRRRGSAWSVVDVRQAR